MSPASSLPATGFMPEPSFALSLHKKTETLIVPVLAGEEGLEIPSNRYVAADALLNHLESLEATGALGEITRIPASNELLLDDTAFLPNQIVALGLGEAEELDDEQLRRAAGVAGRTFGLAPKEATRRPRIALAIGSFGLKPVVEGFLLGAYNYRGFIEEQRRTAKVAFIAKGQEERNDYDTALTIVDAVTFARDLVNTPASHLYPASYAKILSKRAEKAGTECEILTEKQLKKNGFGGIIAVSQGSQRGARLVRLEWAPKKAKKHVAFVGKGITFDTGGISLKPAAHMEDMISDMGGSAAVAATVFAAAALQLDIKVTATIPLAENMPSGSATRPGDVITHYGGITSEVINTDAEGRLVLADALVRACEDKPDYLIDTATLTGAQLVALGNRTAGVMGTERMRDWVAKAGRDIGEQAWAMPLLEEHEESLRSPIADIRNTPNSRDGGMLYAASYLRRFVSEDVEWAHVDIAGPAFNNGKPYGYIPQRATGAPVRTFVSLLQQLAGA